MKKIFLITVSIIIVFGLIILYAILGAPNKFEGDRFIFISKGSTFKKITDSLESAGIIRNRTFFELAGRILGKTTQIQIGKYRFRSGLSNSEIVDIIGNGKTIEMITVTIPEGLRATTQAKILSEKLGIDSTIFMKLVKDSGFSRSLGVDAGNLMGYLMPKTYNFYWQTDETDIIKTMVGEFWEMFYESMKKQTQRRGMTINNIITMASIIELETAIDSERVIVAGVYYNRLHKRMRLQADPTVQFALGGELRRLKFSDYRVESVYNTYKHYGLPPGPINNPGKASIIAALYPARHKYLFFVATGEGGHRFTSSYSEHQKAIKDYRRVREEQRAAQEVD
ncbi:MAG: endolytic transglycosylase MltG [Bacteroidota bacterium]|nr:endolytic transglycosylase MltG [Bacteroidota bacterium]